MTLFTIVTLLLSSHCEALLWNDGHMELEDPQKNFDENNSTLNHLCLNRDQALELRDFLNRPDVVAALEK